MPPSRPRAFISYRHAEYDAEADADILNAQHRAWVAGLARDLDRSGVEAVYDGHLRDIFRPLVSKDPLVVPFLAEVSTISCLVCHAFLPLLTPSYLDRLGYAGYQRQDHAVHSFAFEEWQIGQFYANNGVMQYVPIIRAGDRDRIAAISQLGVSPDNAFDMRDPADYALQVQFIAQRIIAAWDGDDPLIRLDLADWVSRYMSWCRNEDPRCASAPIDDWTVDLLRPRLFLQSILGA